MVSRCKLLSYTCTYNLITNLHGTRPYHMIQTYMAFFSIYTRMKWIGNAIGGLT